jgi:hypothetical protein
MFNNSNTGHLFIIIITKSLGLKMIYRIDLEMKKIIMTGVGYEVI